MAHYSARDLVERKEIMQRLFDTHTHLNATAFKGQEDQIIQQAHEQGVGYFAVVGFDRETIERSLALSERYDEVISVIGWHPTEAYCYSAEVERWIEQQLEHPKVKMYGEIGLDYHWDTSTKAEQWRVFRRQIAIAKEHNLPITIHNRDATDDVYQILKEEGIPDAGGIMHSFGEGVDDAKRFLDLGMHLSFSGVLTFKKTEAVRQAAAIVPDHRLLIETDAPYLAPEPMRGKQNQPAYVRYVAERLAQVRQMSYADLVALTTQNAFELFRWKGEQS